ncbi:MAG: polyprotein [Hangzhou iflavirus 1]|nr:MAG: polyprotein [Hangzhou iflavirus 1]
MFSNKRVPGFSYEEPTVVEFEDSFVRAVQVPPRHTPPPLHEVLRIPATDVAYSTPAGPHRRWYYESYALTKRSFEEFISSITEGLPRWRKIAEVKKVLEQSSDDWECRYMRRKISSWRQKGRIAALHKKASQMKREESRRAWLEGGLREANYRRKYPFGNHAHAWFNEVFTRITGVSVELPLDEDCVWDAEEWVAEANAPASSISAPRRRLSALEVESNLAPADWVYPREQVKERDATLLAALRRVISLLREQPTTAWATYRLESEVTSVKEGKKTEEWAMPQMDGLTGDTPSIIQSENVVLTEANPASSTIASIPTFRYDWHQLCTTEKNLDYSSLTDRFTLYKCATWTTQQLKGSEIEQLGMDLPVDFVDSVSTKPGTMPMFIPFKIHRYFKSDIEIKLHLNSNKFQVGQLQVSWQYLENYDGNKLANMYSRSQLPHVLLNAGASNEATLRIPFKYVQPYLSTAQRKGSMARLYLGTLRCFIVSPLAVGEGGPASCNLSVFIRFPNAQFTGLRDGDIAEPQMEAAAAAMIASAAYDKFIGDKNCDNKTDNVNPQFLVPTAAHSFCAGTGMSDRVHALRLDNSTIAVGRVGIDDSETNISIPCRTFGMLKHITWSMASHSTNSYGTLLWSCDVNAQIQKDKVESWPAGGDTMAVYAMPPMSVVTSLYKQWRGSIEFRFDIIASQFHTGRLLCAYVPGVYGDMTVTIEQARNSAHVEFNLQDSTSFTFVVPYISDRVFWPRRYTGPHKYSEEASPSKIFLFVLNPLIPMQSIVNKVDIIPYVRAGVDFEVSVPVQPSIGLSDNSKNAVAVKDKIYPTTGSSPYRITNYKGFGDDKKVIFYEGTAALGTASTFHAPERKLKDDEYFYGVADVLGDQPYTKWEMKDSKVTFSAGTRYIVLWSVPGKGNYGIPFPDHEEGLKYAKLLAEGLKKGKPVATLLTYVYDYHEDSPDTKVNANLVFTPQYNKIQNSNTQWEFVSPQMEDSRVSAPVPLAPTQVLPSTSGGRFNFNEQFTDLKDLARRYQLYADVNIKIPSKFKGNKPVAIFPVIPHGLELDTSTSESVFNIVRDGHIPVISSGYIYFRGSIRFKIVLSADSASLGGLKCWVQHHPDGDAGFRKIQVYPNLTAEDSVRSHTYALHMQAMNVNSIIEFEVPFYQPGMYGLTRKPVVCSSTDEICHLYTLGNIIVGISGGSIEKAFDFNMQVFYSIGDDFSFNVWRGFPPVVFSDEVWPANAHRSEKEVVWITGEPQMMDTYEVGEPEMGIYDWFAGFARTSAQAAVPAAMQEVKDIVSVEVKGIRAEIREAYEKSKKFELSVPTVTAALGNLAHIMNNPTPRTIAIGIANVIISFFSSSIVNLAKLIDATYQVLKSHWWKFVSTDVATPEGEDDETSQQQFCALIFTSVCMLAGKTVAPPGKFPDILRNINSGVSLYNNSIRLIQNSSDLIKYCIKYIVGLIDPRAALAARLYDEIPEVQKWYKEATFLLDVRNRDKYVYDRLMMGRVFDASMMGNLIISAGMNKATPSGKLIIDTHKEIRKLQADLIQRGAHPDVRFEVFPLWISGKAGIGKSYLVKNLARKMLESVNIKHSGSMIYDVPSGAKYWSGCTNPAVLVSDDIFQVTGTRLEEEIANVFTIVSSSVLNPPMAAVEDKEKRLNPYLYIMLCNHEFPTLEPTLRTPEALFRRRRFLVKPQLKIEWEVKFAAGEMKDASEIPREVTENFDHLEFYLAKNVKDPATDYRGPYSYQAVCDILCTSFKKHCEDERKNFVNRMHDMYCLDPDFDDANLIEQIPELEQTMSLAEQMEIMRQRIRDRLDIMEDPRYEDEESGKYIRLFVNKTKALMSQVRNKSRDVFFQSPEEEPSPSFSPPLSDIVLEEDYFGLPLIKLIKNSTFFKDNIQYLNSDVCRTELAHWSFTQYMEPSIITHLDYFTSGSSEALSRRLELGIYRMLGVDMNRRTYALEIVKDLMSCGGFDWVDKMRFMCILPAGLKYATAILMAEVEEEQITDLDNTPYEELDIKNFTEIYGRDLYKSKFRYFLKSLEFNSGVSSMQYAFRHIVRRAGALLTDVFVDAVDCSFLETAELQKWLDAHAKGVFSMAVVAKFFHHLDSKILPHINKCDSLETFFFKIKCKIAGSVLIMSYILGTDNKCRACGNNFKMLSSCLNDATFCSVRYKLEFLNQEFSYCDRIDCVYNNPILYFTCCYMAVSCKKTVKVKEDAYGHMYYLSCPQDDVKRALRNFTKERSQHLFAQFGRWVKHVFYHVIPEALSALWNAMLYHLPKILLALGVGLMLGGVKYGFTGRAPLPNPEGYTFKYDTPKHHPVKKVPINLKSFIPPQSSPMQVSQLAKIITNNTCFVVVNYVVEGRQLEKSCRCLILKGRVMLILRHYWEEYQYLVNNGHEIQVSLHFPQGKDVQRHVYVRVGWDELQHVAWCGKDAATIDSNFGLCTLPSRVPMFKDITKVIASVKEHSNVSSKCDLYVVNGESKFDMTLDIKDSFAVAGTTSSSPVYMGRAYTYKHQYKGLCGSVLVSKKGGSGNGAIIGIHVAGSSSSGSGFAEPLVWESIDGFFTGNPQPEVMPIPVQEDIDPEVELDSNLLMFGCVPPQFSHKESGKSKIVPSLLHGEIYPVRTEVNPLKPGDPRQPPGSDPLRDGCNKHGSGDIYPFDAKQMALVTEYMADKIQQVVPPVRAEIKPLTMQQAVCGDVDVEYFESLNWKSSEGFPLSSHRPRGATDKRWLFRMTQGEFGYVLHGLDPKLELQMKLRDRCFEKGVKPPTVYIDCLKDYRLTPEKCALPGKTRIFSIAPVQCSIDIRMYINDFCASIKKNRIYNGIGIGMNPDSFEWTQLVNYLFEVGNKIITLDYSNYGPCLMSQSVVAAAECVVKWFEYYGATPEHVARVKWLLESDIVNPVHLCKNVLYQTVDGIASGSPLTGEMNSIPNLIYIRNCYLEIMSKINPKLATMTTFDEKVRIVVYGDDLIMSVSDDISEIFNAISIRDCLATHGIKVTPAQKNAEMVPYTSIYEATFLKRSFVEHPIRKGIWLAPIERASIEECLNWVHVSDDPQAATLECCRASLDLAYSQGPEYYQSHYQKIKRAINRIGLQIEYKPWHQRDSEIFGDSQVSLDVSKSFKICLPWTYAPSEQL